MIILETSLITSSLNSIKAQLMKNLTKTGSFSNSLIKEVKTHAGLPFVAQLVKNLPAMGRAGFNP